MSLIMLAVTISIMMFLSIYSLRRYIMFRQRIERITSHYTRTRKNLELTHQDVIKNTYIIVARKVLNSLKVLTTDTTKSFTKRLANAGWLSKNSLIIFLSIQLITIFSAIFLGLVLALFVPSIASKNLLIKGTVVVLCMWLGYRLPEWYLNKRIKAYQIKLRKSLLDFLDLFLICIEAGFGNDKALERITHELKNLHPEFAEQANILITELRILPNRRDAWDNFAERTGLEEIKVIVTIIKQSEQLGTSISAGLRAQVEMFRSERLSYVEQKAMRLPTMLTLPLVIFIFPALLLVILGPAVLKAIQVLSGS